MEKIIESFWFYGMWIVSNKVSVLLRISWLMELLIKRIFKYIGEIRGKIIVVILREFRVVVVFFYWSF